MTIALIQSATNNNGVSVGDTLIITFGTPVGSGNTVVGFFARQSTSNAVSVVDNQGNTYALLDSTINTGDTYQVDTFIRGNITNAPTIITITVSAGTGFALTGAMDEISGAVALTSPIDGHVQAYQTTPGTGTDGITSGNITTAFNGDLIWGSVVGTQVPAHGTGYTATANSSNFNFRLLSEWKVQASAGAVATTFTQGVAGGTVTAAIGIQSVAAVVTGTPCGTNLNTSFA